MIQVGEELPPGERVYVDSDEMPPTRHPVTGKIYTSRSKLRADYKAKGYEEIGTAYENGFEPKPEPVWTNERRHELRRRIWAAMDVNR